MRPRRPLIGKLAARDQDAEGDGQVEPGAVLADVGGGQVHGDPPERKLEPGIGQRRADPLPAFPNRAVRQADGGE